MKNTVSLEETYADEPTPKAGALTIDPSDAKALDDFVRHISIRCYDEFQERSGSKSRELRLHLERMRELLDKLLDYPKLGIELYCLDTRDIQPDEVDASLLSEVVGRAGLHFHEVDIYQLPDDISFGVLQIAVDDEAGETCGLVRIQQWPSDIVTAPGWTANGMELDETIQIFVSAIPLDRLGY